MKAEEVSYTLIFKEYPQTDSVFSLNLDVVARTMICLTFIFFLYAIYYMRADS